MCCFLYCGIVGFILLTSGQTTVEGQGHGVNGPGQGQMSVELSREQVRANLTRFVQFVLTPESIPSDEMVETAVQMGGSPRTLAHRLTLLRLLKETALQDDVLLDRFRALNGTLDKTALNEHLMQRARAYAMNKEVAARATERNAGPTSGPIVSTSAPVSAETKKTVPIKTSGNTTIPLTQSKPTKASSSTWTDAKTTKTLASQAGTVDSTAVSPSALSTGASESTATSSTITIPEVELAMTSVTNAPIVSVFPSVDVNNVRGQSAGVEETVGNVKLVNLSPVPAALVVGEIFDLQNGGFLF